MTLPLSNLVYDNRVGIRDTESVIIAIHKQIKS